MLPALCLLAAVPVPAAGATSSATASYMSLARAERSSGASAETVFGPSPLYGFDPRVPPDDELASSGAVVGEIIIRNENIFDTADPREDNWLFRLANKLHVKTRPWVIRGQLLFRTGDPYDRRLLEESERILRSNRYFYDVWVRPVAYHEGRVDVEVTTRDVWTLRPGFSFGRAGGANTVSLDLEEMNLFGWGIGLGVSRSSTPDRTISSVSLTVPRIADTWVRTDLLYGQYSDGWVRALLVERPFYALDTRWAGGVSVVDNLSVTDLVNAVHYAESFQMHALKENAWAGWSAGLKGRWVRRYIVGFARDISWFAPAPDEAPSGPLPPDRKLAYPWVGFELREDAYQKARNRNQIARTEDFYLGTSAQVSLGYAAPAFGADRSSAIFSARGGTSFLPNESTTVIIDGGGSGRYEGGSVQDAIVGASGVSYVRLSPSWLAYSFVSGKCGVNLDPDHQMLLGGDNGLRGYPRQYQAGDRSALLTLEARYYTTLYLFRLFRIGGAAFYDMGRAWGGEFANPDSGVLRDFGAGLRIALARSGQGGVIHVDVAFPVDGDPSIAPVQFLVYTKVGY